jgi:hypothetical protein
MTQRILFARYLLLSKPNNTCQLHSHCLGVPSRRDQLHFLPHHEYVYRVHGLQRMRAGNAGFGLGTGKLYCFDDVEASKLTFMIIVALSGYYEA